MRAERKDDEYVPPMPPCDAEYLLAHLFDIGPVVNTGAGTVQLRSEHIIAWQNETGIELQPWEARTLRRLSCDYLAESQAAEKREAKSPWLPPDAPPEVSDTQAALRELAKL